MVFQLPQYWGVIIDGIQIVLGILILVVLIRNRRRFKHSLLEKTIAECGQGFNMQFFLQTIKQQIDQAFANITRTVAVEQANLSRLLQDSRPHRATPGGKDFFEPAPLPEAIESSGIAAAIAGNNDPHEQTLKLAVAGLSARQISEKLKIPVGEVELILSLQENERN